jgi:hypothetical protein
LCACRSAADGEWFRAHHAVAKLRGVLRPGSGLPHALRRAGVEFRQQFRRRTVKAFRPPSYEIVDHHCHRVSLEGGLGNIAAVFPVGRKERAWLPRNPPFEVSDRASRL